MLMSGFYKFQVILLIATISVIVLVFGYNKDVGVTICVVGVITLGK